MNIEQLYKEIKKIDKLARLIKGKIKFSISINNYYLEKDKNNEFDLYEILEFTCCDHCSRSTHDVEQIRGSTKNPELILKLVKLLKRIEDEK
jgi:hypothetical protein